MGAAPTSEPREREAAAPILTTKTPVYHFMRTISWLFAKLYCRHSVEGVEKIPKSGGVVIAGNHASHLDIPIASMSTSRHVSFVARDTLANSRVVAYVMRECGAVLVRRGSADTRALREMVEHLRAGDCVAIYPEGTRTLDGKLGELKGGALLAARMAKAPIVPMGIDGSYNVLSRHHKFPRPAKVRVRFGDPIDPNAPDAQERLREALMRLSGEVR